MRCAVIGDPAMHSLSPAIHRAGYRKHGMDWVYDAITVPAADVDSFIDRCRDDGTWTGLSVTAPHKEAVLRHGEPDHVARLVGAGNTLVLGERPRVHNTDVPGFVRAWREHDLAPPQQAVIVGNGATARSILVALAGLDSRRVTILARDPSRATPLVDLAVALGLGATAAAIDSPLEQVDLLASTVPTSATAPHALRWAAASRVLFDVVYDPWPTPLAAAAEALGRRSLNGLDLLAGQAVDQFFLLTGREVTFRECRSAATAELRRRGADLTE